MLGRPAGPSLDGGRERGRKGSGGGGGKVGDSFGAFLEFLLKGTEYAPDGDGWVALVGSLRPCSVLVRSFGRLFGPVENWFGRFPPWPRADKGQERNLDDAAPPAQRQFPNGSRCLAGSRLFKHVSSAVRTVPRHRPDGFKAGHDKSTRPVSRPRVLHHARSPCKTG